MGQATSYAALWVKSNFSFLEGASHPEELVAAAHAHGLAALALTDRDGVYGSVRAHVTALPLGLPLIHGAQISVGEPDELLGLAELGGAAKPAKRRKLARRDFGDLTPGTGGPRPGEAPPTARPIVLLATSRAGYGNLCKLISRGRLACPKGHSRVRLPELAGAGDDLIALCSEPDMLPALREPFAGRLYALVARHREAAGVAAEARLRATAGQLDVPTVAAVEVLYHDAGRRPLQDVLTCIRLGRTLGAAGTAIRGNAEHALASPAAMHALFADDPAALARTLEIAARCKFSLTDLRYRYPAESVPAGSSEGDWLRKLTLEGARARYDGEVPLHVRAQLERELADQRA
jgi:error-prone DNA polymerase